MPASSMKAKVLDAQFDWQLPDVASGSKNISDLINERAKKSYGQSLPSSLRADLRDRFNTQLAEAVRRGAVESIMFELDLANGAYLRVKCMCNGKGGAQFYEVPLQGKKPRFEFNDYGPKTDTYIVPR